METAPKTTARPAWQRLFSVLLLLAVVWFGVFWLNRATERPRVTDGIVPPLQLTLFDGRQLDLATLAGQGVVVNFWASWCEPCRVEAELFEAAWRTEQTQRDQDQGDQDQGIVFIGVNHQDTPAGAQSFLEEFAVSYPNGADTGGVWSRAFGIVGLPTTFFIDAQGEIQSVVWGPITSERELARHLEKIRP